MSEIDELRAEADRALTAMIEAVNERDALLHQLNACNERGARYLKDTARWTTFSKGLSDDYFAVMARRHGKWLFIQDPAELTQIIDAIGGSTDD